MLIRWGNYVASAGRLKCGRWGDGQTPEITKRAIQICSEVKWLFSHYHIFLPYQSAQGCDSRLGDLGRSCGAGAGPQPHVCVGWGEGKWWGRVGPGAWRPSSAEVSAVATESPGAAPSEPGLLLLTPGEFDVLPHWLSSSSVLCEAACSMDSFPFNVPICRRGTMMAPSIMYISRLWPRSRRHSSWLPGASSPRHRTTLQTCATSPSSVRTAY